MTSEVTFLQLVSSFQTHTVNVQPHFEINRTLGMAELATLSIPTVNLMLHELMFSAFVLKTACI